MSEHGNNYNSDAKSYSSHVNESCHDSHCSECNSRHSSPHYLALIGPEQASSSHDHTNASKSHGGGTHNQKYPDKSKPHFSHSNSHSNNNRSNNQSHSGHNSRSNNSRSNFVVSKDTVCYNCGGTGHMARQCPSDYNPNLGASQNINPSISSTKLLAL